jgi:hypothetical protein
LAAIWFNLGIAHGDELVMSIIGCAWDMLKYSHYHNGGDMSKKHFAKQPLAIPGKPIENILPGELKSKGGVHMLIMSKYAGSIEFSDDEFSAMLRELEDDK